MIDSNPLENALSDALAQKRQRNYISPRRRRILRSKTEKLCSELLTVWEKQRRYDEDSSKYESLEKTANKLIDSISKNLDVLGIYSVDWMIVYRERFNTTL